MSKKKSTKISEHFSYRDFMCKCEYCEGSVKISLGLVGGLELLRSKANRRINILKGYVCPEKKEAEGSVKKDFHTYGLAADITIDGISLKDAFLLAETVPEFKGIGLNIAKKILHVDTRKEEKRKLWVIDDGKKIELTPENRAHYLGK